jgi:dTMP kinase
VPFVSFEGVDGAGKTTQLTALGTWLESEGHTVLRTKEPGGGHLGQPVRDIFTATRAAPLWPIEELLLVNAARYDHVVTVIRPALARGEWVLTDRFFDSTYAIQVFETDVPIEVFNAVVATVVGDTIPDITFVLNLTPNAAEARRDRRGRDDDPSEQTRNFDRICRGFLQVAASCPERCKLIDADAPASDVELTIRGHIQPLRRRTAWH